MSRWSVTPWHGLLPSAASGFAADINMLQLGRRAGCDCQYVVGVRLDDNEPAFIFKPCAPHEIVSAAAMQQMRALGVNLLADRVGELFGTMFERQLDAQARV